jgi:hypothetical protein
VKRKPSRKSKPARVKKAGKARSKIHARRQVRKRETREHGTYERDAVGTLVEANAQALGIPLNPAWRDGIAFNLRLILRHAKRVEEFALPDDAEPAPVFHA